MGEASRCQCCHTSGRSACARGVARAAFAELRSLPCTKSIHPEG